MREKYPGKQMYPHLFSTLRIGNIRLKNRIIAAPTSPSMITREGFFTPEMRAYLEEKALGGAAVVTYGESIVHSATGKSHNKQLQLDSFGVKQGAREVATAIHNAGGYANIQLSHGGMYGGLASVGGNADMCAVAYGPSEMEMPAGHVDAMPREMIYEIIESYAKGAALCRDCGFDMVEVHAAHGWLFSQFLSPVINKRDDEFGGSLENRARFLMLSLDAVRKAVGRNFPIEVRLSGDDMTEIGLDLSQCIEVAKLIEDKVDLFNISCGNHEDPAMFCRTHPSSFFPRGVNVYLAAEIKKNVNKPVSCVGALEDPAMMEELIASGKVDAVEIGRALLADPYLPKKALEGHADDITPCLRCYECFGETSKSETVKCTVNPTMGKQLLCTKRHKKVSEPKKVLVAGGGPAGMVAAITAAKRGHIVTLAEKSDRLGGNLHAAGAPYFKKDIEDYRKLLERRLERSKVNILLNTEVDEQYIKDFNPDVFFAAVGSEEIIPPIKGIDLKNVVMATEAELHPEKLGENVAIIGGGLVGAEAAVSFAKEGKKCSVIEMKGAVAEDVNSFYRGGLMPHVEESATLYTNTTVKEITPDGVCCDGPDGEVFVKADTVVVAAGFKAPYDEVDRLCELTDEYYIIGDCSNVAQIYQAVNAAYFAALNV